MRKRAIFVDDSPAQQDALGTHFKIADDLASDIGNSDNGYPIALIGEWGSGKSTVVGRMAFLLNQKKDPPALVFNYDAWAHQGDPLRRSFLSDLINTFSAALTLDSAQVRDWNDRVWSTTETTTKTTTPLLSRHAILWSLTLPVSAIALKFFPALPTKNDFWTGKADIISHLMRNWILSLGVGLPAIVLLVLWGLTWVRANRFRSWLFSSLGNERPNVFAFFIQKTVGATERVIKTSPSDSVTEFGAIFSEVITAARKAKPSLKIVIVLDNIDRLPAADARVFWATMQTFFGERTGGRLRPYWLLASFSKENIQSVFGAADSNAAESFIEKTFSRAIFVPKPILASWRGFALDMLRKAFPDHGENELVPVRDVFAFSRGADAPPPTPRQIKTFTNQIVSTYRQRSDDISLAAIAAYVVLAPQWTKTLLADDDMRKIPSDLIPDSNGVLVVLSALHFGVSLDDAAQIVLSPLVNAALQRGEPDALEKLLKRRGSIDVLTAVVHDFPGESADAICMAANALGGVTGSSAPAFASIWLSLSAKMSGAAWNDWSKSHAEGAKALLTHAPAQVADQLLMHMTTALRGASVSGGALYELGSRNVLKLALVLAEASDGDRLPITLPANEEVNITILQLLSQNPGVAGPDRVALGIKDVTAAIAKQIELGLFILDPLAFLQTVEGDYGVALDWKAITYSIRSGLLNLEGVPNGVGLLRLTMAALARESSSSELAMFLSDCVADGTMFAAVAADETSEETLALTVCLFVLTRQAMAQYSAATIARAAKIVRATLADTAMADAIADVLQQFECGGVFAEAVASDYAETPLPRAAITVLIDRGGSIDVRPSEFQNVYDLAALHGSGIEPARMLAAIKDRSALLDALANGMGGAKCYLLLRDALPLAFSEGHKQCLARIKSELLNAKSDEWRDALSAENDADANILNLALDYKKIDGKLQLELPAFEALRSEAMEVASGEHGAKEGASDRAGMLASLMSRRRGPLATHFYGWLKDQPADAVRRGIEYVGSCLALPSGLETDAVLRGILVPLLETPNKYSLTWMLESLSSGALAINSASSEAVMDAQKMANAALENGPDEASASLLQDILAGLSR